MINGLMGFLMAIVVFIMDKNNLTEVGGAREWVAFPVLSFVASILYALQGSLHHLVSMAVPNFLVVMAVWLQVLGVYRFHGKSFNKSYLYLHLALSAVFFVYTSGKSEYFRERLMFVSGSVFVIFLPSLRLLWLNRKSGIAAVLMLLTLFILNLVMLLRFVTAWAGGVQGSIYDFSVVQAVYLGIFSFGSVLLGMSAILFISERYRLEIQSLLNEDSLTGAKTRRSILDVLEYEVERARRMPAKLSIMMIDLDYFKQINDEHGHVVGDEVLRKFVQAVKASIRRPSEIGRYGGEEFLVVLPGTDAAQALQVAERIREAVRAFTPGIPSYTISIGIEELSQSGAQSVDPFISKADAALYEAKRMGRDRVVVPH
jgi:diguanylate cyclase (GGDEF)-like protein